MAEKKAKSVTVSSRGAWIISWLIESRDLKYKNEIEAVKAALSLHYQLLMATAHKNIFWSKPEGDIAKPINVLDPAEALRLPNEASADSSFEVRLRLNEEEHQMFDFVEHVTDAESDSMVIENALAVHYDLLAKHYARESLFIRNVKDDHMTPMNILKFLR